MANVLRRVDSDMPAMGFFYGEMLDAKNDILLRLDNDESRYKTVLDIIDNRWDNNHHRNRWVLFEPLLLYKQGSN
jgi:hypothetical protein